MDYFVVVVMVIYDWWWCCYVVDVWCVWVEEGVVMI